MRYWHLILRPHSSFIICPNVLFSKRASADSHVAFSFRVPSVSFSLLRPFRCAHCHFIPLLSTLWSLHLMKGVSAKLIDCEVTTFLFEVSKYFLGRYFELCKNIPFLIRIWMYSCIYLYLYRFMVLFYAMVIVCCSRYLFWCSYYHQLGQWEPIEVGFCVFLTHSHHSFKCFLAFCME